MKSNIIIRTKLTLFIFLFTAGTYTQAQNVVIKYYDANWTATVEEKATYYAEFVKEGSFYNCNSYVIKSKALRGKSSFQDTTMEKPLGLQTLYYPNGNIEDSAFYDENSNTKDAYHFHQNKQLAAHYYVSQKKEVISEGFDEEGKKLKNYIYAREAAFKSGDKGWQSYLLKNVEKDFSTKNNDEETNVSVHIEFVIDEDGYVTNPKVIKSSGLKHVDADALKVIASSPQWVSAVHYNKPVRAFRMQPFSYRLLPQKK